MVEKRGKASERDAFRLIEDMLELMESRGLVELEMEHEGLRIRLKKATASPSSQVVEYSTGVPHPVQAGISPAGSATPPVPSVDESRRIAIKSPMVGTFYRASAPDAPPFVEVGQDIAVDQVVCILEAMKLMNEIKSEVAGVLVEILAENGAPVEFGQPLFVVEPRP